MKKGKQVVKGGEGGQKKKKKIKRGEKLKIGRNEKIKEREINKNKYISGENREKKGRSQEENEKVMKK